MLLRGNKGKGREKGKMKKTEGYVIRKLEEEYVRRFGPLRAEQAAGSEPWSWVENPWPWEGGQC